LLSSPTKGRELKMIRWFQILKKFHPIGTALMCFLPILVPNAWVRTDSILPTSYNDSDKLLANEIKAPRNLPWLESGFISTSQSDDLPIAEFQGIVIDDLSNQFSRQGPDKYWHENDQGYEGHSWWTQNNQTSVDNVASWRLGITQAGTYAVFVYIPTSHATTQMAVYTISHNGDQDLVSVNQNANRNSWYKLGDFSFAGTGDESIKLVDKTGEANTQFEIAFDAVGYSQLDTSWEDKITGALWERIQPWLDEKTAMLEETFKDWLNEQKGKFLQKMADILKSWIDQQCASLGATLLFPLFAFVLWHRKSQIPPKRK